MIRFNFNLQLILCAAAGIIALSLIFNDLLLIFFLILQAIIGAIQFIASFFLILFKRTRNMLVLTHFGLSVIILALLTLKHDQYGILLFIIPWLLALFLPTYHISFT